MDADRSLRRTELADAFAEAFAAMVRGTDVRVPSAGMLAGPEHMNRRAGRQEPAQYLQTGEDNLHFPLNVPALLRLGFAGIEESALRNARSLQGEPAGYLRAVARCYGAARDFCSAHAAEAERRASAAHAADRARLRRTADCCRALSLRAPAGFHEAVQLFWFAWCMRGHGTIGRLDQHLWPCYRADVQAGRLGPDEARELLCELWRGFNRPGRGDTLRNLMLGGQDADGRDATNELSLLMLDAALAVRDTEPHLNVRLHGNTPSAFLEKVLDVQFLGHGQGTIFNDEVIVPSLVAAGVPVEAARNYANDGCSEIVIDGLSGIELGMVQAVKSLELALFNGEPNVLPGRPEGKYWHRDGPSRPLASTCATGFRSGDFAAMRSFEEFYAAFLRQYLHQVDRQLDGLCHRLRRQAREAVSAPFMAGTFPQCLQRGLDPHRGGFAVPCCVFFAGSIPTVADGLAAVRQVVFRERVCTPGQLLQALRADFEGHEGLRQQLLAAPKFGNNIDEVDELAADVARRVCRHVKAFPTPSGKPIWPALFNHLYNDEAKIVGATPDGRRWKDPIAEHYSPTPGRARCGPTAVIGSVTKGPLAEACGTSIFNLSLSRTMFPPGDVGRRVLGDLVKGALKSGAAVMNVAIYDVARLRDAQTHPEAHQDLLVRVWGYSARFVDLSEDQQEHIIARTQQESP